MLTTRGRGGGGRTFSGFGGQKIQVCRDKCDKCVSSFQDHQVKRLYKVDA